MSDYYRIYLCEWKLNFFIDNIILYYEVKNCQDMLRARKEWGKEKRFILKNEVIISIDEILVAIEVAEKATQKKKKKIDTNKL